MLGDAKHIMLNWPYLNFPSPVVVVSGAVVALGWAYCCLSFAGFLKTRGLRTGYTRKLFHALIFLSAVVANALGGFVAVCVFGVMVSRTRTGWTSAHLLHCDPLFRHSDWRGYISLRALFLTESNRNQLERDENHLIQS